MASSTIISRKMIKLLSPTPSSLRCHKLSFMDHINFPLHSPYAFFYPKIPQNYSNKISQVLENSLSKVLSFYYPLAGKINNNYTYVDCNDTGAEYLNVRIDCPMSQILNHPYNDVVDVVFPQDLPWSSSSLTRSPLVVQLSHFDCGGVAVSACTSHTIFDGYCLSKFINDWASTARNMEFKPSPQFNASTFFPLPSETNLSSTLPATRPSQRHVSRMYNFSSSNLTRLKDIVTKESHVKNPTRVEVASALVHKCGVTMSMESSGMFKPTLMSHAMNLRPPIPLNTMGNATCIILTTAMTEDEVKLPNFVAKLQKDKQQLRDKLKDMKEDRMPLYTLELGKNAMNIIEKDTHDVYLCSGMTNTGLHKIDFGWGEPVRVTLATHPNKNNFIFMDEQSGDGLNVLITLTKDDMLKFQSNKELLEFASPVVESTK
ncbi:acylsugar acyltransferase 3 [Solanum lycopersicum]|uniref:Acylsugar acyltransferase 3 n=1 Tax=Solanum lycopersicum TaxID=4081 RepID=ASAT3_SOLLC|nr:acylsugar acyltransferase 3 [Solanum lycopersicum]K4D9Y4.1 RecName: Full=Acylsugar acyltransferase 3; Short=Sl-ASAT3 [Solanum lycopersicum]AJF98582.1 acylsugar acyltransferase 3 [Solanum lycopersicum]